MSARTLHFHSCSHPNICARVRLRASKVVLASGACHSFEHQRVSSPNRLGMHVAILGVRRAQGAPAERHGRRRCLLQSVSGDPPVNFLQLVDFSSNAEVLAVLNGDTSDVQLGRIFSDVSGCQNVTATFTFDKMAGTVAYALSVQYSMSNNTVCSAEVSFVVVGFTIYEEIEAKPSPSSESLLLPLQEKAMSAGGNPIGTTKIILSGEGNEVRGWNRFFYTAGTSW